MGGRGSLVADDVLMGVAARLAFRAVFMALNGRSRGHGFFCARYGRDISWIVMIIGMYSWRAAVVFIQVCGKMNEEIVQLYYSCTYITLERCSQMK